MPVFGPAPQMDTMVVMMIFTMMALGLNVVVGYAGLLDLGYVAFYAIGAYMAGWFASSQFATHNDPFRRRRHHSGRGRLPLLDLADPAAGGDRHRLRRHPDRPADAAPARRLPGDRHARLRRDHPADRAERRQPLRHRLQPHQRHAGHHADRRPRLRQLARQPRRPAGELPGRVQPAEPLLLDSAAPRALHGVLLDPAARLAARPRVDRDPRGRDRRRRDGRAADADEDMGVRDGRVLRRRRRRVLRELQVGDVPRRLLLQHLRLHPLHGHPRRDGQHSGASSSARASSPISTARASRTWAAGRTTTSGTHLDVPLYEFGIFGVILVVVMLFRPEGLIPSQRRAAEFREGVHDEPLYDTAGPDS